VKLHAVMHVIIENQVALGDEVPAQRTLRRLMAEGLDRHQGIHAISSVLTMAAVQNRVAVDWDRPTTGSTIRTIRHG
jgi:hypothetical protein